MITTWDQIERRLGSEASLPDIVNFRWCIDYESPKMILATGLTHSWGLRFNFYYLEATQALNMIRIKHV